MQFRPNLLLIMHCNLPSSAQKKDQTFNQSRPLQSVNTWNRSTPAIGHHFRMNESYGSVNSHGLWACANTNNPYKVGDGSICIPDFIRGVTSTRIAQLYSGFGPCRFWVLKCWRMPKPRKIHSFRMRWSREFRCR